MKFLLLISFTILGVFMSPAWAVDVRDLGSYGFTCHMQKPSDFEQMKPDMDSLSLGHVDFSFHPKGLSQSVKEKHKFVVKDNVGNLNNKTIFVFSALDKNSVNQSKTTAADYGICIEYNSLDDIKNFREASGVKYPIQLGNENIISFFKIQSYPALITIKNGTIYVESYF